MILTALLSLLFFLPNLHPVSPQSFKQSATHAAQNAQDGTLTIGSAHRPTLINPVFTHTTVSTSILTLVFNGLVRLNPSVEFEPELAASWEQSEDGLVFTFHLRKDVKFHDGQPFTAEDVVFTYECTVNPESGSPFREQWRSVESFKALDAYTVQIRLPKKTQIPLLFNLTRLLIIPKHIYGHGDFKNHPAHKHPIGSGPFRFSSWNENHIALKANTAYFEGKPSIDKVIYKSYQNQSEVWTAFMRGEIDLVKFIGLENYELTRPDPSFQTFAFPIPYYYALTYNMHDEILNDRRVRLAIAHAVDRRALIERLEHGYAEISEGPFSAESPAFNKSIGPVTFNPDRARVLLEEAGWDRVNESHIRVNKNGTPLAIRVLVDPRRDELMSLAQLMRQQLQAFGIRFEVYRQEGGLAVTKTYLEERGIGACLMLLFGGAARMDEATDIFRMWVSEKTQRGEQVCLCHDTSEELKKMNRNFRSISEEEELLNLFHQLHAYVSNEQLACFLYRPYSFHAASKRVKGAELLLRPYMRDYIIKDFQLENVVN